MIRTTARDARRAQRHQHLAVRAELHDLLSALVALWGPVRGDSIGHPDVAVLVDIEPVRPDEHAAAEALDDRAVRIELVKGVCLGVATFVAEPRLVVERFAPNDGPDVHAVRRNP